MALRKAAVRPPLTGLENQIMNAIWTQGPSTVETVHQSISPKRPIKEATTRTLLRRLEAKGYLRHKMEGRAFVYHPTEPPRNLAARAVRQIIHLFCQGSVDELVSGMVEAKVISSRDLDRLSANIRKQAKS